MGMFAKLFGRSRRTGTHEVRCNECGMTGGEHTDWCPTRGESEVSAGGSEGQGSRGAGRSGPRRDS